MGDASEDEGAFSSASERASPKSASFAWEGACSTEGAWNASAKIQRGTCKRALKKRGVGDTWHSEFRRMFDGLMSRCSTSAECMYLSALKSWYITYCLWISWEGGEGKQACIGRG